jgi:hypothetical protein
VENKNLEGRKIAKCTVSCNVLTQLFTAGFSNQGYSTGAPKDLIVVGVEQTLDDYYKGIFHMYFTSKENAVVTNGEEPPEMDKPFMVTSTRNKSVKTD